MTQQRKGLPQTGGAGINKDAGPYIGVVKGNADSIFNNRLQVWIPEFGGNEQDNLTWHVVGWASPYYGIDSSKGSDNITSYGMWMSPPAIGTKVLVVFVNGDHSRGYWIASIPDIAHGMIPAVGTKIEFDPTKEAYTNPVIPSVERKDNSTVIQQYQTQGLSDDKIRGPGDYSSYRESPSKIDGWSTPGGHSLILDDGGQICRLRTAQGNQLVLNDASGTIYAINAKGTAWIELSASGQIDMFGAAGINMATNGEVNIHADKGVNIHTNGALKLVGMAALKISSAMTEIFGTILKLEGVNKLMMHSCTEILITSYKNLSMKIFKLWTYETDCISAFSKHSARIKPNEAEQVAQEAPKQVSGYNTTVNRAPSKEPFKEHDNGGGAGNGGSNNPSGTPLSNPAEMYTQPGLVANQGISTSSNGPAIASTLTNTNNSAQLNTGSSFV